MSNYFINAQLNKILNNKNEDEKETKKKSKK